jgi:alpha-beta hydrolase superfamily lysophospholipase
MATDQRRNGGRPPRDITVVRLLLLLTGAGTAVNGLLELDPEYAATTHVLGYLLIAFGAACWWVVLRLRAPGRGGRELAALLGLLVAIRIYQAVQFRSPSAAAGLILPALVYWRLRRPAARGWLREAPRTSGGRRALALLGAVGLTASVLVALAAAGTAAAAWPCTFPHPAAGALDTSSDAVTAAAPTGYVRATDKVRLAYYAYLPQHPLAALVFYHGSGANTVADDELPLGRVLAAQYHIATYLVDIRGHGASGGPRGDTPTPDQTWRDVATMAAFVHQRQPGVPEFLGGHSAGAGLILNSLPNVHTPIAGYVFLAPDFGLHSDTERVSGAANFATLCLRPFVVNAVSNHALDGHTPALGFAYTTAQVRAAHLVDRYTVNMALAQNPQQGAADLRAIKAPLAVWIGSRDEVFDPAKVLAYARGNRPAGASTTLVTVPGASHLGILDNAAARVGPWITTAARPQG